LPLLAVDIGEKNLVRVFSELGVLAAVSDSNQDLSQRTAEKYKVLNLSFEQIISDNSIEGIVISSPAGHGMPILRQKL